MKANATDLRAEFREIVARLEHGERYLAEHPDDGRALRLFQSLLQRTVEINRELAKLGEERLGRDEQG